MKNNLFLAISMALNLTILPVFALDNNKLPEIADKAYWAYIQFCKVSSNRAIDPFKNSSEYKELKGMLEDSLKANNNYKINRLLNSDIKMPEQLLTFGKLLKAKLSDKTQMLKDCESTNPWTTSTINRASFNNYGYFEALKAYNLHALFFYTLGDLTQEQKDVIEMAYKLGDLFTVLLIEGCQYLSGVELNTKLITEEECRKQHEEIKNSPLMQKLRDEELAGIKLNSSWFKAESVAPNLRLFIQAFDIAITYEEEIFRKYNLNGPVARVYSWQIKKEFHFANVVLQRLGYLTNLML